MARVMYSDSEESDNAALPPPPAQQPAAKTTGATSRPLKRVARFLGDTVDDDDDDNDGYNDAVGSSQAYRFAAKPKKRATPQDVDRMFADLEEEEERAASLPPPLRRQNNKNRNSNSNNNKNGKSRGGNVNATQNSVIDDTIFAFGGRNGGGGDGGAGDGFGDDNDDDLANDKIEADAKTKKPKRKAVLMNEERLLGDKGIRRLKENLKGFKIKGKGHEEDDLRRLMNVYQLWAHQMFPAGSFKDTVRSVETLCKKTSVKVILRDWRNEAKGILPPPLRSANDNSDDDDEEHNAIMQDAYNDVDEEAFNAMSNAGSPDRAVPKKSYFDDIPTSSPGGALSRDYEMGEGGEDDLAESLFGGTAPASSQLFSQSESVSGSAIAGPSQSGDPRSEASFNDTDLQFDLDEEDFDMDAEAEAAMREAEAMAEEVGSDNFFEGRKSKTSTVPQADSNGPRHANSAISFYSDPKAVARVRQSGKELLQASSQQQPSSSPAPRRNEADFEDFDFDDEEDILREVELAEQREKATTRNTAPSSSAGDTSATASELSKTPSLVNSAASAPADIDYDSLLEDDLQTVDSPRADVDAEPASSQKAIARRAGQADTEKATSPLKTPIGTAEPAVAVAGVDQAASLYDDDDEDLYS